MSQAITYNGVEYKSKSAAARALLEEGTMKKGDIAKELGVTYQTVHAIQKQIESAGNEDVPSGKAKKVIKKAVKKKKGEDSETESTEDSSTTDETADATQDADTESSPESEK